ncbi:MAG: hypothetical protein ABFS17_06270 [Chloroflexota bacterium]
MKNFVKALTICFIILLMSGGNVSTAQAVDSPPTNVSATDGLWAGWVRIDWDSTYTDGFHSIWRATSAGGSYTHVDTVTYDITYFQDTTATTGTNYYYKVKSCFDITCSSLSDYDLGWRGYINTVTSINAADSASSDYTFVTWSATANADYYNVQRSISVGGTKTFVGTTTSTFIFDDQVTPNNVFYYYVMACNNTGIDACSEYHDYDAGQRAWPVVQNVAASDGGHPGFVRVTWDAVSGAGSYRVYYSTNGGSSYLSYETASSNTHDYSLPLIGFEYTFAVTPCFSSVCGGTKSTPDIGWLDFPSPTNVTASVLAWTDHTQITWDEVDSNAWYYVFRDSVSSPSGKTLAGYAAAAEIFSDYYSTGALPGTNYNYWVIACPDTAVTYTDPGCSDYSTADIGVYTPATPQNVLASDGTSQAHVQISWDAVDGISDYRIQRSLDPWAGSPVWADLGTSASNSYQDTTAVEGTTYYYRIRACGSEFCGDVSSHDGGYLQGVCYALTLNTTGNGSITPSPTDSLGCSVGEYIEGETIELVASPDSGWNFDSWTNTDNDAITSSLNYVTMPASVHAVTATFSVTSSLIFTDGFESGDLSAWTRFNSGSGFLDACTQGAVNGTYSACVTRGSNDKRKQLIDDTPNAETSFSARFNFNINSLSMTNGERFRFMQFKMDAVRPAFIVLKYDSGQYSIQLNTLLDDLTKVKSGWIPLPDAVRTIEVEWQQSSGESANNGYAKLYLNDVLQDELTGLDNFNINITSFRMGFTSRLGGKSISGVFYIDDVATSNTGYIGLP